MKNIRIILVILGSFLFGLSNEISAQMTSPDNMITYMRDKGDAYAFTLPGWLVRLAGNIADKNLEEGEKEMVNELTNHIKKIRFAVSQEIPMEFDGKFKEMKSFLQDHNYEALIEVRDGETNVNIWGLFDEDIIERLVVSVVDGESTTTVFNIKSDIDLERLQGMAFFKELQKKNSGQDINY